MGGLWYIEANQAKLKILARKGYGSQGTQSVNTIQKLINLFLKSRFSLNQHKSN
ncbi:hypothetical protein Hanom_Chr15g01338611 [Helianthus anomalus]